MERFKRILKSPVLALGLAPLIFAFSQVVILGYYWTSQGYAGNLTLTISRYVGLSVWSSVLFAICNFAIVTIMFRYYLSLRSSRSTLWFVLSCVQALGFLILSICPHNNFITDPIIREIVNSIHIVSSRLMFLAMFCMALETLRLSHPNHLTALQDISFLKAPKKLLIPKNTTKICVFFAVYGLLYVIVFLAKLDALWGNTLIIETGYIYSFMAFLLLTRKIRASDV